VVSVPAVSEGSELAGLVSSEASRCPPRTGEVALVSLFPSASSDGRLGACSTENVYSGPGSAVTSSFSCGFVDLSVLCSDWIDLSIPAS
jgi:hypothetical protein